MTTNFWTGIAAARGSRRVKQLHSRHWLTSVIVGLVIALLIAAGLIFVLVGQLD
jgi:hypothetical protein